MSEYKDAWGTVSGDPLRREPAGSQIGFKPIEFRPTDFGDSPISISNWELFGGAILAVAISDGVFHCVVGSAFVVGPGIAITATHNFIDEIGALSTGDRILTCIGIRTNEIDIWTVRTIHCSNNDISILTLQANSKLPPDRIYRVFGMTTRTPKNEEMVHVVGFRSETVKPLNQGFVAEASLFVASGKVTAVYPNGRDRTLLPYPAIELRCGSLGGMSGGIAVDANGLVVGIISRGLQTEENKGPTYISWIVGALGQQIEPVWPPGLYSAPTSLADIDNRIIYLEGRDALSRDATGNLQFRIWFD